VPCEFLPPKPVHPTPTIWKAEISLSWQFSADDPNELIGPAVQGTVGILKSVTKNGWVGSSLH
jgi:hypothetical protein